MVWSILNKKLPNILGIDISPTSIKLLELSKSGDHFKVEHYGVAPLFPDAMVESDVKDVNAIAEAVKLVVSRARTKCRNAIIAVPGSSVITKTLQFDADLDENEIEAQVQLEASRYIPYPMQEVSLDFQVLGQNHAKPDKIDVFVAASRTEKVNSRVNALAIGGLTTSIVDVETYAIERACQHITDTLPNGGKHKTVAIIDIGSVITSITVLHHLSTIYTREEVFGGQLLTEAIQKRYSLIDKPIETAERQGAPGVDCYTSEALEPFKEALIPLIRRSLQFFFSASHYNEVDHIVLAGDGALIPGLADLVTGCLGTKCTTADPFINMTISSKVDRVALTADAPALMVCCGLALRTF